MNDKKKESCASENLDIIVKASRTIKFKGGADLATKVNRVIVDFNEEIGEDTQLIDLKLKLEFDKC